MPRRTVEELASSDEIKLVNLATATASVKQLADDVQHDAFAMSPEALFALADKNSDGSLNFGEFKRLHEVMQKTPSMDYRHLQHQ